MVYFDMSKRGAAMFKYYNAPNFVPKKEYRI
jgi:hypothetical protein